MRTFLALLAACGVEADPETRVLGGQIDPAGVTIAEDHLGQGSDPVESTPPDCTPPSLESCEFETYNLDVSVGDRFRISRFVECAAVLGVDYTFSYDDGETWNLDAMNRDDLIEILAADEDGGNHGDGEYRFQMIDGSGDEIDHMTIRVRDGDSDISPDDQTSTLPADLCGGAPSDGVPDPQSSAGDPGDVSCPDPAGCF